MAILLSAIFICINWRHGKWPFRKLKRQKLFLKPFSIKWIQILRKNVPIYKRLPEDLKAELHGHIHILIAEKNFEGCGGLKLTDEIKVTIAAQASILLLNRNASYYPRLSSILVYPSSYRVNDVDQIGAVVNEEEDILDGESWGSGAIVLAWDHIKQTANDPSDGYNLVIHEFAHQFEFETIPTISDKKSFTKWARVLNSEFQKFQKNIKTNKKTILDEYGAEDPYEFFSVASEAFFEKSAELKSKMPELYRELAKFYNVDPAMWVTRKV